MKPHEFRLLMFVLSATASQTARNDLGVVLWLTVAAVWLGSAVAALIDEIGSKP